MVPALLAESGVVSAHHPLGASTGYMSDLRGDWPAMVAEALATSPFAAELAAMPEAELVRRLARLAPLVDGIVVHPDAMDDPRAYRALGSALVLENMDARKT